MIDKTFEDFWEICPKKTDKKDAALLWDKLKPMERFNAYQGMKHHSENNPQWKNKIFIPNPARFLRKRLWMDEVAENTPAIKRAGLDHTTHVSRTWAALTQLYGESWVKRHGETAPAIWSAQINNLSEKRIKRALQRLLSEGSDFPCSLPKFVQYAAETFDEQHPAALPKSTKTDKETALKHLAKIRAMIA